MSQIKNFNNRKGIYQLEQFEGLNVSAVYQDMFVTTGELPAITPDPYVRVPITGIIKYGNLSTETPLVDTFTIAIYRNTVLQTEKAIPIAITYKSGWFDDLNVAVTAGDAISVQIKDVLATLLEAVVNLYVQQI